MKLLKLDEIVDEGGHFETRDKKGGEGVAC
jgi:hypothetical protein